MKSRNYSTGGPFHHIPVMLNEVLDTLALRGGNVYVDGTFGAGGHSKGILDSCKCNLLAVDRDKKSIEIAQELKKEYDDRIELHNQSFSQLPDIIDNTPYKKIDGLLLDLGISSLQLDNPDRGFSFQKDGPLDMRMDTSQGFSASSFLNESTELEISNIIYKYGEEKASRRIAKAIVKFRKHTLIQSTSDLVKKRKAPHLHVVQ